MHSLLNPGVCEEIVMRMRQWDDAQTCGKICSFQLTVLYITSAFGL